MPAERVSMRKIRDVLRLTHALGMSRRLVGEATGIGKTAVGEYVRRASVAGLSWPIPVKIDDAELERRLFPPADAGLSAVRAEPDWSHIHTEMKGRGVTLALLWEEYRGEHAQGYASNYTYAEARWTETLPDWIGAHVNALSAIGGVPKAIVPDNLKAGITKPSRYEPGINRSYQDLADHYGFVVLPTRVRKPRDKAKVEVAVLIVERFVLAKLRNRRFFSLDELNAEVRECVATINAKVMKKLTKSRRELLETIDRPALKQLPSEPYRYAEWKRCAVAPDYHVEIANHYYSVPFRLLRETVEARLTDTTVEVFHKGLRVASHPRSSLPHRHTTIPEHMPSSHRRYAEWTPQRMMREAASIGPATIALVEAIMKAKPHPEQGFRSCLGIMHLVRTYGSERVEAASRRGNDIGATTYGSIKSILQNGLDKAYANSKAPDGPPMPRDNQGETAASIRMRIRRGWADGGRA